MTPEEMLPVTGTIIQAQEVLDVVAIVAGIVAIYYLIRLNQKVGGKLSGAVIFFIFGMFASVFAIGASTFFGHTYTLGGSTFDIHHGFMSLGMIFFIISAYKFSSLIPLLQKEEKLNKLNEDLENKVNQRTVELQKLILEQNKSAKMLVRRDLELTKANEELQELDSRKSEFLSIAAHQLRTPLSGIKWTISMILNGELGALSSDQRVFLMKSYESNERMINLVDDLLHADRIDSGKYNLNLVRTQLLDLIDNVLYDILPNAQKGAVKIEFNRGTETLPPANIDQEKMRAVFQNLLDNAVKYSLPGSVVSISAKSDAETITFAIKDGGIGIPPDQQTLLFSRFFRARNALKIETDGSGLGLFIVKSIIERHGGKIWFESEENKGTTFYFTIKL